MKQIYVTIVMSADTFQCIIDHLTLFHRNICLKYCALELNEVSGSAADRTNAHMDIIPADGDTVVTADNSTQTDGPRRWMMTLSETTTILPILFTKTTLSL